MNLENLDESLAEIRQAAKEYYARKSGTWKPKRDLDAELLEDEARFRREVFMSVPWMVEPVRMMRYSSGPEKIVRHVPSDPEKIERIRKAFEHLDMSALEERIRDALAKKIDTIPTVKIGEGKNPMAEHTIRAVKKSHAKRRFSKKSRRGIL